MADIYDHTAVNGMVNGMHVFLSLDGGSIKSVTELLTVDQGVNVTLECVVDANPVPEGAITWSR